MERHGARFLRRIYTEAEQDAVHGVAEQYWAARFAAKEAAFKALGTGWARGVRWVDVEVGNLPSGQPVLSFHGDAARRAQELAANRAHISISHTARYAVAQVILERDPSEGGAAAT
jgi:holo-[acyl-carrier protein] synthase